MISRRGLFAGFAGLSGLSLAGCGSRAPAPSFAYAPPGGGSGPAAKALHAGSNLRHNVTVSDFNLVRKSDIMAAIHKATEGGDWIDSPYANLRGRAESAGR